MSNKPQKGQRAALPRPSRKQPPAKESRGSLLRPRWATEVIAELRKVTWPSREDTWYLTFVVVVVAAAFGLFLGGVDMFFNWLIENTLVQ
jgi:preprotein translocase subunit SecE